MSIEQCLILAKYKLFNRKSKINENPLIGCRLRLIPEIRFYDILLRPVIILKTEYKFRSFLIMLPNLRIITGRKTKTGFHITLWNIKDKTYVLSITNLETLSDLKYMKLTKVLITHSWRTFYENSFKIWNIDTGECLKSHFMDGRDFSRSSRGLYEYEINHFMNHFPCKNGLIFKIWEIRAEEPIAATGEFENMDNYLLIDNREYYYGMKNNKLYRVNILSKALEVIFEPIQNSLTIMHIFSIDKHPNLLGFLYSNKTMSMVDIINNNWKFDGVNINNVGPNKLPSLVYIDGNAIILNDQQRRCHILFPLFNRKIHILSGLRCTRIIKIEEYI